MRYKIIVFIEIFYAHTRCHSDTEEKVKFFDSTYTVTVAPEER
jgi:hypothetical protein